MRKNLAVGAVLLILALVFSGLGQAQTRGTLWDGSQWQDLPMEAKVGYVKGVGNMADYDKAVSGNKIGLVSRALGDEWRNKSISQIVQEVDRYYQQNPQNRNMPVIEVVLRCSSSLKIPEPKASGR